MPRTTLNLDDSVLRALKERGRREGKAAGQVASELLARALHAGDGAERDDPLEWSSQAMRAKVDLEDEEALEAALRSKP